MSRFGRPPTKGTWTKEKHPTVPGPGRPPLPFNLKEACKRLTPEAIETLCEIYRDKRVSAAARALAANSIVDRAHGKPHQTMDMTVRRPDEMSEAELAAAIANAKQAAIAPPVRGDSSSGADETKH